MAAGSEEASGSQPASGSGISSLAGCSLPTRAASATASPRTAPTAHALPLRPPAVLQQQVVGLEAKVKAIVEMGFGREQALAALKRANGDEQQAMEVLLGA